MPTAAASWVRGQEHCFSRLFPGLHYGATSRAQQCDTMMNMRSKQAYPTVK